MSTFNFKEVLKAYLQSKGVTVHEVTDYQDYSYEGGYCETCAYTDYSVGIYYSATEGGPPSTYVFDGRFSSLIEELESLDL